MILPGWLADGSAKIIHFWDVHKTARHRDCSSGTGGSQVGTGRSARFYDEAQAVLKSRYRWSRNHTPVKPKAFLGLLHCATCGGAINSRFKSIPRERLLYGPLDRRMPE